jgi:hypothetical protein
MILRYAGSFNEIGEVIKNRSEPFTKNNINQIVNIYQLNSVCFLVVGDVSICRVSDNLLVDELHGSRSLGTGTDEDSE